MSVTKILFKQGTSAPSGQDFTGTNGEPLWDSNHKKLYVSNGTTSPTLIGPIKADWNAAAGSPGEILNKPTIPSADNNDEIQDLTTDLETEVTDTSEYTSKMYMIGKPEQNITQYWLDITDFEAAMTVPQYYTYIDPLAMIEAVGEKKKITLFFTGAPKEEDPTWTTSWEYTLFPLFWLSRGDQTLNLGNDYNFRIWDSGTLIFDTKAFGVLNNISDYGIKNLYDADLLGDFLAGIKPILDRAKYTANTKCTVKLEFIPTQIDGNGVLIDIHMTYPANAAVVVQNMVNTDNATQIASINNNPIYIPAINGQLSITGAFGTVVVTSGGQQVVEASLSDYSPIGNPGSASSEEDANITAVSLTNSGQAGNEYGPGCLCVQETSAFGSDASVSYNAAGQTLSWTPSSTSRSYVTKVVDTLPNSGKIYVTVLGLSNTCQSDHYLYLYNASSYPVTIEPSSPDNSWSDYPVRGIPRSTILKSHQGVEISLALRRYSVASDNTAVMTASEPLSGE